MFGWVKKLQKLLKNLFPKKKIQNSGWAKIEEKSYGSISWTEYTDHNGYIFMIYDMMAYPGFKDAKMINND